MNCRAQALIRGCGSSSTGLSIGITDEFHGRRKRQSRRRFPVRLRTSRGARRIGATMI
jgi:hypothetical protein